MTGWPDFLRRPRAATFRHDPVPAEDFADADASPDQSLIGRIVHYIPADVVGLYVAYSGIVEGVIGKEASAFGFPLSGWYWFGFWFCLCVSPFWMYASTDREGKPAQRYQIFVTPIAFFAWALALGGPFRLWLGSTTDNPPGQYSPAIASCILLVVTATIGGVDQWLDSRARRAAARKAAADQAEAERKARGDQDPPDVKH